MHIEFETTNDKILMVWHGCIIQKLTLFNASFLVPSFLAPSFLAPLLANSAIPILVVFFPTLSGVLYPNLARPRSSFWAFLFASWAVYSFPFASSLFHSLPLISGHIHPWLSTSSRVLPSDWLICVVCNMHPPSPISSHSTLRLGQSSSSWTSSHCRNLQLFIK
jgi:hypothetical protein